MRYNLSRGRNFTFVDSFAITTTNSVGLWSVASASPILWSGAPNERALYSMISRLFSSSLIAAGQLQPANLPHRSAAHLHKCAAWALNTSRFFSDGSIRRIRKTKRKSSLTKRVVDAVEAYKEIYGNLEVKHRYLEMAICGVAQFLGSLLVLDTLSLSGN